mmetsp:Transcript_65614/g.207553  ORF Transcript_65614/g.207553 Transcript_65614/m.207553 type:complete len:275 (-) Transcript_65614:247-1071(-)
MMNLTPTKAAAVSGTLSSRHSAGMGAQVRAIAPVAARTSRASVCLPSAAFVPRGENRAGADAEGKVSRRTMGLGAAAAAAGMMGSQPAQAGLFDALTAGDGSEFMNPEQAKIANRIGKYTLTDDEWRAKLGKDSYRVRRGREVVPSVGFRLILPRCPLPQILRQAGTEFPLSSPLNNEKRDGIFACGGCGQPVFDHDTKYESGSGWPSFYAPLKGAVMETKDYDIPFQPRVEVRCSNCQGHLGHVFRDGPKPTGLRYCMNGLALTFVPAETIKA